MQKIIFILFSLLLISFIFARTSSDPFLGEYRAVISATRYPQEYVDVGNVVRILEGEALAASGLQTLRQALDFASNMNMIDSGGTKTGILKGYASNQTRFMVNGVEMKDATTPQGTSYLDALLVSNIDRIEIIEGAMSTVYGSDALAGVVNIILKSGPGMGYVTCYGQDFSSGALQFGIPVGPAWISVGYEGKNSAQLSWKSDNIEKDQENVINSYVNLHIKGNRLDSEVFWMRNSNESDLDGFNASVVAHQTLGGVKLILKGATDMVHEIRANQTESQREYDGGTSIFKGKTTEWDIANRFPGWTGSLFTLGLNGRRDQAETTYFTQQTQTMTGVYGLFQNLTGPVHFSLGMRFEEYPSRNTVSTYSGSIFKKIEDTGTLIKLNASTGFRSPTLYERLDSFSGNTSLTAELSTHFEADCEQQIGTHRVNVSWFKGEVEDKIDWVSTGAWTGQYFNVTENTLIDGVSIGWTWLKPVVADRIDMEWTKIHSRAGSRPSLRVPFEKFTARVGFSFFGFNSVLSALHKGKRWDSTSVLMPAYTVLNIMVVRTFSESMQLFVKGTNILHENYEDISGYNVLKDAFYLGLKGTL